MIGNPEAAPLTEKAIARIDGKVERAAKRFIEVITEKGQDRYYREAWKHIGAEFRAQIRRTVKNYQTLEGIDNDRGLRPFPRAIERGLAIGAFVAKGQLSTLDYPRFSAHASDHLEALRVHAGGNPLDLADVMRLQGSNFAKYVVIANRRNGALYATNQDEPIELRREELFLASVGYMGTEMIMTLTEGEMRRAAPNDRAAANSLRIAADLLTSEEYVVPIKDLM